MGLFFLINGWAGRFPLLDEAMRFLYVGTIPVLATALLGLLLLLPPAPYIPERRRVFAAVILALALCGLSMLFVDFCSTALGTTTISPRPFMTRYVNVLVVEPQDNCFPSPEVMLAAALATGIWALRPRYGVVAAFAALLLGFARIFCGTNYVADIVVGLALGWGWMTLSLAACHVELRLPTRQNVWHWKLGFQTAYACVTLFVVVAGTYGFLASDSRFENKLRPPWGGPATATELPAPSSGPTSAARGAMQEGEGVPNASGEADDAEALALMKRSARFLPEVEKYMRGVLSPRTRPFHLLDVEVAPVRFGTNEYRCAALRFEVTGKEPQRRRAVAAVAASLIKAAFHADSRLENVDVTAIIRGDGKAIDDSDVLFVGDEVPVFTASVQRKNLLITPQWANQPNLDPGLWLRMRSRLYINNKILPEEAAPPPPPLQVQIGPPPGAKPAAPPRVLPSFGQIIRKPVTPAAPVKSPAPQRRVQPARRAPSQPSRQRWTARRPMPTFPAQPSASAGPRMSSPQIAPAPVPAQQPIAPYQPPAASRPQEAPGHENLAAEIESAWRKAQKSPAAPAAPTPQLEVRP